MTFPFRIDKWLNENEPNMKKILKTKNPETFSDKCFQFETFRLFFIRMISCHSYITNPLILKLCQSVIIIDILCTH